MNWMKKFETDFYSKYDVKSSSFICLRNSCSTGEANTIPFGPLFEHMQEMKESDMSKIKYFPCGLVADCTSNAGCLGLILGWGTRSHMLQQRMKVPHATTKIRGSQANTFFFFFF